MKYTFALCFLMIMAALDANAQPKPGATLLITNAAIYTVDNQHPRAEAVAVIGDRIVAVGSKPEIDSWRGPQTEVIDAGGKLLLPGFNDAHLHFIQGGAQLEQVNLVDAATPEEFAKRIAAQADGAGQASGRIRFARPMLRRDQRPGDPDYYDVSFSGLKTAVLNAVKASSREVDKFPRAGGGGRPADVAMRLMPCQPAFRSSDGVSGL